MLSRSIISLYADDPNAEDRSIEHEIKTAISLISRLQRIMVLSYHAKQAYFHGDSMIMHRFVPGQSSSETILSMLRPDRAFTPEEARMLDIMMCLHAEHGGGNNSTFTTHVVTSSGTDTYSCMAAALASLKGPKHGGANIKVIRMFEDMKEKVRDWKDEDEVRCYLQDLLDRKAFDKAGLIYGMGHAVYSLSDPRATRSTPLWRSCPGRRAVRRSMSCTPWWSGWAPRSSPGSGRCIRRIRQCGLLFRFCLPHAGSAPGALYPPLCHGPGGRMERPPYRGAHQHGQIIRGLQVCGEPRRIMRRLRSGDLKSIRKKCVRR